MSASKRLILLLASLVSKAGFVKPLYAMPVPGESAGRFITVLEVAPRNPGANRAAGEHHGCVRRVPG